jgi:hypothetical protein
MRTFFPTDRSSVIGGDAGGFQRYALEMKLQSQTKLVQETVLKTSTAIIPIEVEGGLKITTPGTMAITTYKEITVQKPITIEKPYIFQRPVTVIKPVITERPVITTRPVLTQRPITVERPVLQERATTSLRVIPVERPTTIQRPITVERPLIVQRPILTERTVTITRPIPVERPIITSERPPAPLLPPLFPSLGFGGLGLGGDQLKKAPKGEYQPSFIATQLNIRASAKDIERSRIVKTGFGLRPIIGKKRR